jgi:hypothetical protein
MVWKGWLSGPERVVRAGRRSRINVAVAKDLLTMHTTKDPLRHSRLFRCLNWAASLPNQESRSKYQ